MLEGGRMVYKMRKRTFLFLVLSLIVINSLFLFIYVSEYKEERTQELSASFVKPIGKAVQNNLNTEKTSYNPYSDNEKVYYSFDSGNSGSKDSNGGSGGGSDIIYLRPSPSKMLSCSSDPNSIMQYFQGFFEMDYFELYIQESIESNETNQSNSYYHADFLDLDRNLLKTFNFSVYDSEYSDTHFFEFVCEVPSETKYIVFNYNSEVLYEFVVSDNAPEVSNIDINFLGEDLYNITWQAQDLDGDNLTFDIFLVEENVRYNIGSYIGNNYFLFDSYFIGQGNYKIKIKASDGFYNTEQESGNFNLGQKEPFVEIYGINENDEIFEKEKINVRAEGFDPEDGFLRDFVWYLDDAEISSEQELGFSPETGEHILRLEAEDSDGNMAEDFVNFSVVDKASIFVEDCGILDNEGSLYKLTENILMQETRDYCFEIIAPDITLDCQGNLIQSYALTCIYSNSLNTTIQNCNIQGSGTGSSDGEFYEGIFLEGADYSYIFNNTLEDLDIGMRFRLTNKTQLKGNAIKNTSQRALSILDGSVIRASFSENDIDGNILIRNATLTVF
jgi:hypothetical protein